METRPKKPKEKRRNNEKRKEKSRDAARCRRSRETDIFTELAAVLPIPQDQAQHLDKASVMRLAIAYLKACSVVDGLSDPGMKGEECSEVDALCPTALDGFMLVLDSAGDMVYLSENVSEYLGIPQMDMMGQSVFEYGHPCDHEEIRQCLAMTAEDVSEKRSCNFFLRFKCTLTNKGRKVNLKSASYKVIHCIGHPMIPSATELKAPEDSDEGFRELSGSGSESEDCSEKGTTKSPTGISLVLVGCPIPHPSNIEVPLGRHTFLSKHNLSMKFTYADDRLAEVFGWSSNDLMGKSVFEFHHALDDAALSKSFKSLFSKGQCETSTYRFLNKTGGYAWVVTQATLIRCPKQNKPLSVVCVNYILSGIECENEIYSDRQLEARNAAEELEKTVESQKGDNLQTLIEPEIIGDIELTIIANSPSAQAAASPPKDPEIEAEEISEICEPKDQRLSWLFQDKPVVDYDPARHRALTRAQVTKNSAPTDNQLIANCRPQTATASIFAPRTEEMNTGFLIFSEDQPGLTMLKDEPEDLTHLAPTPGDVCVPLEDTPFLTDMLDEFILGTSEVYCPLLSPCLPPDLLEDSVKSPEILESDPFFYRDTPSPHTSNSGMLTPIFGNSPGPQSLDSSLHSPIGNYGYPTSPADCNTPLGSAVSDDDALMLSINDVIVEEELAIKGPYIPMSDQEEALQLLISNDMVMWGPTQSPDKRIKWDTEDEMSRRYADSSLAKLLKNHNDELERNLVDPVQVLGQTCRRGATNKRHHSQNSQMGSEPKRIRPSPEPREPLTARPTPTQQSPMFTTGCTTISEPPNNPSCSRSFQDAEDKSTLLMEQLLGQTSENSQRRTAFEGNRQEFKQDDGGGGFSGKNYQQSNSVLMNLLVSGCDETYLDLPHLLEDKVQRHLLEDKVQRQLLEDKVQPHLLHSPNPPQIGRTYSPLFSCEWSPGRALYTPPNPMMTAEYCTYGNQMQCDDGNYEMAGALSPRSELLRVLEEVV